MGKVTTPTDRQARRHNPLADDILATGRLTNKAPKQKKGKKNEGDEETFVNANQSRNILRLGRELADEDEASKPVAQKPTVDLFGIESRYGMEAPDEENKFDDEEAWGDEEEEIEEVEVDPEDLEMYRKFMPESGEEPADMLNAAGWGSKEGDDAMGGGGTNLTELILEKIAAHEEAQARKEAGLPIDDYELPPKVVEAYTKSVPLTLTLARVAVHC